MRFWCPARLICTLGVAAFLSCFLSAQGSSSWQYPIHTARMTFYFGGSGMDLDSQVRVFVCVCVIVLCVLCVVYLPYYCTLLPSVFSSPRRVITALSPRLGSLRNTGHLCCSNFQGRAAGQKLWRLPSVYPRACRFGFFVYFAVRVWWCHSSATSAAEGGRLDSI